MTKSQINYSKRSVGTWNCFSFLTTFAAVCSPTLIGMAVYLLRPWQRIKANTKVFMMLPNCWSCFPSWWTQCCWLCQTPLDFSGPLRINFSRRVIPFLSCYWSLEAPTDLYRLHLASPCCCCLLKDGADFTHNTKLLFTWINCTKQINKICPDHTQLTLRFF